MSRSGLPVMPADAVDHGCVIHAKQAGDLNVCDPFPAHSVPDVRAGADVFAFSLSEHHLIRDKAMFGRDFFDHSEHALSRRLEVVDANEVTLPHGTPSCSPSRRVQGCGPAVRRWPWSSYRRKSGHVDRGRHACCF